MKKLLILSAVVLSISCNSGDTETSSTDSAVNMNTDVKQNDLPMRTTDTSQNLMEDTMKVNNDTMKKGSKSH